MTFAHTHSRSLSQRAGGRAFTVAPVALIVSAGVLTIALKATQGPRSSHIYWLTLVLVESAVALLLRRRHPMLALGGVLATYLVFDYPAISTAPVLLALFTVAIVSSAGKTVGVALLTVLVIIATPLLQRGPANVTLAALMLARDRRGRRLRRTDSRGRTMNDSETSSRPSG